MGITHPVKMDLNVVRRLVGDNVEVSNRDGAARIALLAGAPLDKGTDNVKLYWNGSSWVLTRGDGADLLYLDGTDLNFINSARFIKNLAGIKDSAGNKRMIIVQPGDDVKSKIENAPNGSWVLILPGDYYVGSSIDITTKRNLRDWFWNGYRRRLHSHLY